MGNDKLTDVDRLLAAVGRSGVVGVSLDFTGVSAEKVREMGGVMVGNAVRRLKANRDVIQQLQFQASVMVRRVEDLHRCQQVIPSLDVRNRLRYPSHKLILYVMELLPVVVIDGIPFCKLLFTHGHEVAHV